MLGAAGDDGAATYLQNAYDAMMQQADEITDAATRETFLQKVRVNQAIVVEMAKVK